MPVDGTLFILIGQIASPWCESPPECLQKDEDLPVQHR